MRASQWRLELYVNSQGHAYQVNAVGLDDHAERLDMRVVPLPLVHDLDTLVVPLLYEAAGIIEQLELFPS